MRRFSYCLALVLCAAFLPPTCPAADAGWSSMNPEIPGTDGEVRSMVFKDGNLYIGGDFTVVQSVKANSIAKWDGNLWSPLGEGIGNDGERGCVQSIAFDSAGNLYAGGNFMFAGGVACNNIAKWDGTSWSALGKGFNDSVETLAFDISNILFVGGEFSAADDMPCLGTAKWDGTSWSALGNRVVGRVFDLAFDTKGSLYIGGYLTAIGSTTCSNIEKWDGKEWSPLGEGVDGYLTVLACDFAGNIYAGGGFTTINGNACANIAKWNGASWLSFGEGMNASTRALACDASGIIYAAGHFSFTGTKSFYGVATWNGNTWSPLGEGMNGPVFCLAFDSFGDLYAGGSFTKAGTVICNNIAKWDGRAWSPLGEGVDGGSEVYSMVFDSLGNLYVGGFFSSAGTVKCRGISKWDGISWSALGSGVDGGIYTLAFDNEGSLYAGGLFAAAGEVKCNNIAMWNGRIWASLGQGISYAYWGVVHTLAFDKAGDLYAGGYFTNVWGYDCNSVVKWNGTSWSPIAEKATGYVNTLAIDQAGNLYAGGWFPSAGSISHNGIIKWNGKSWLPLGEGVNGEVNALAFDTFGNLYACGAFATCGGIVSPYVGNWKIETRTATFTAGNNGSLLCSSDLGKSAFNLTIENGQDCPPVTAIPDEGYEFACWVGDLVSLENPLLLKSVSKNIAVIAKFRKSGSQPMATKRMSMGSIRNQKIDLNFGPIPCYTEATIDQYEFFVEFTPPDNFYKFSLNEEDRLSFTIGSISFISTLGDGVFKNSGTHVSSVITLTEKNEKGQDQKVAVVTVRWSSSSICLSVKGTPLTNSSSNILDLLCHQNGKVSEKLCDIEVQLGKLWYTALTTAEVLPFKGMKKVKLNKKLNGSMTSWRVKGSARP